MSARPSMVAGNLQVVDKILDTKRLTDRNNISFAWAVLFICMAGLIYLELTYGTMDWSILDEYSAIRYLVDVLMILLLLAGVFLLVKNVVSRLITATLEITTGQQRLCGVSDSEPGFRIVSPTPAAVATADALVPKYSPSSYTGRPSYFRCPTPVQQCMPMTPQSSMLLGNSMNRSISGLSPQEIVARSAYGGVSGLSPQEIVARSAYGGVSGLSPQEIIARSAYGGVSGLSPQEIIARSAHGGGSPSYASQQGSSSYMSSLLNGSYQADLNTSSASRISPTRRVSIPASPVGYGSPIASTAITPGNISPSNPQRQDLSSGNNVLRARLPNKSSPVLRNDDLISNAQELDSYLQESMTAKDLRLQNVSGMSDLRTSRATSGFSFWSFNRTMLDYIPVIGRYQYQLAPHSVPQSTTSVDSSQHDFSICPVSENVWSKLDVDSDQVDQWVENLRKWICQTILSRLIEEIAEVNKALVNVGSEDVQIGEVSLSTLKQWLSSKGQLVPKLSTLIPFLDLSTNQEYIVQRIRELGSGGCMSTFKWNSGGNFKGKAWEENLPTDSAIVMHLLCCYMDLRLPAHPKYPDGKTFTCQHFLRAPAKPNLKDRKDHLLIYEVRLHPPHYNVVIEDNVWNVKQGRNNLFHAILLFLHHIKTKEHGMLRRVSLGLSGINILWVFDS